VSFGDLDAARIEANLAERGFPRAEVTLLETTGSTNDEARTAAASGASHGAVFVADAQSRGRGRGAHVWYSPARENIYLSLLLRTEVSARVLPPVTLVVGLAVAGVVERVLGRTCALKWPNDVLVGTRKLAGVLVEAQLRGAAVTALIVGVGLNVHAAQFPDELANKATSLRLEGAAEMDRSLLVADLVSAIVSTVNEFARRGLQPFLPQLRARDALRGRPVQVEGLEGQGEGFDDEGRLLVRDASGIRHSVVSGEVLVASSPAADRSCAT
jgi:BirA family biotin operon repressor/biotin-[acetyl-CoA-carboxylase] ligase